MEKSLVLSQLQSLLRDRIAVAEEAICSTRASFASDTKSSAGDKHEVGRAMVQQELDKLEEQRAKLIILLQELDRVPLDRVHERAAFGTMVTTDDGNYFIAIGLGAVEVNGEVCYAISLVSPIGQVLNGKQVGDRVAFNGRSLAIRALA